MAKKNKKETIVDNAALDAFVNEGKDVVKLAEVTADNTEETDGVEVEGLIQEDKDAQMDEIIKTVMEDAVEDEDSEGDDESFECDSKDVKEEPKKDLKKYDEPWYVARAKREADYYNW